VLQTRLRERFIAEHFIATCFSLTLRTEQTLSAFTKVNPEKIKMAEQKDRRKKQN
jgi:hypothetical protein